MIVRRATPSDAHGFAAVVAAVAEEGRWIATEPPVDVEAFAARVRAMLADGHDELFVLDDGGGVVGTLGLHGTRAAGVHALGMAIVAAERGKGHGRAMLRAAIEHARSMGLHKIELEVWPDNERAIALYESAGFEVEGVRRDHYRRRDGSLRSSQIMALLLE
ncbi:MAG: GNAT family N-acetyltransferase [Solirubrobacteraceae bacterium]